MIKATKKAKGIDDLLTAVCGKNRTETVNNRMCMMCDGTADKFRDFLSEKEYAISGMCQKCQDSVLDNIWNHAL